MDNGLLVVIVVVAVIFLLFWLCGSWGTKDSFLRMHKEKSMKKELKHMASSLKKMAHERGDVDAEEMADKLKRAVHKMKRRVGRAKEVNLAQKMTDVSDSLKHKLEDSDVGKELKAMAECLDDMVEDLLTKGDESTKEGYSYYYGGYYRPRWRYWRYYRPYRFYRPYYSYGGYW